MSKGLNGCYIQRVGGRPASITVRLRPPVEKYIMLPRGCSEEEAERIRKSYAEALAAGTLDLSADIRSRLTERDKAFGQQMPVVASVGEAHSHGARFASLPESPGVYFIQVRVREQLGPVKIGVSTTSVRRRVGNIASGFPWPIVALGWSSGGAKDEAETHYALRKHRMNGEWFMPDPVVLEFVKMATEVGVGRTIQAVEWFDKTPEVKQKKKQPSFDLKAYESWLTGESDKYPMTTH
jgi:hypothetical protein